MAEVEEVTEPLQKVKVQKDETVSIAQNYIFPCHTREKYSFLHCYRIMINS